MKITSLLRLMQIEATGQPNIAAPLASQPG
jgi:hypothetical protein